MGTLKWPLSPVLRRRGGREVPGRATADGKKGTPKGCRFTRRDVFPDCVLPWRPWQDRVTHLRQRTLRGQGAVTTLCMGASIWGSAFLQFLALGNLNNKHPLENERNWGRRTRQKDASSENLRCFPTISHSHLLLSPHVQATAPAPWSRGSPRPSHPTGGFWRHPRVLRGVATQVGAWLWGQAAWLECSLPLPSLGAPGCHPPHKVIMRIWLSKTNGPVIRREGKQMHWPGSGHTQVVSPKSWNHVKR